MKPTFTAGKNLALKVPRHLHSKTVAFYRDTLGFELVDDGAYYDDSPRFKFGSNILSIDAADHLSQAELWLQILTSNVEQANEYLTAQGCVRCDEIEPLPEGMQAMWIASPSSTIHLVNQATHD